MKDGAAWPFIIVGLLGASVLGNVAFVVAATGDPSFSVEPNYYDKAVRWDEAQQQKANSDALGWTPQVVARTDSIEVRLTDKSGDPVQGAEVTVTAFHKARANRILKADLQQVTPGHYRAPVTLKRLGLWELRVVAIQGAQRFEHTTDKELFR